MQRRGWILLMLIVCLAQPMTSSAQDLPDGDLFGEQQFSPTIEIMLAAGNGLLAGYNGFMYARGMRRDFVAGLSVITGSIGLAIGLREGANYPQVDVITGVAAILAGGAQLLLRQSGFPLLRVENSAVVARPILVSVSGEPASRIGLSVGLVRM